MQELGICLDGPIELNSDASVAIGISNRVGSGKVCHLEVTQLCLQAKVNSGVTEVRKVGAEENLAEALTKGVDSATIAYHVDWVGMELHNDRHGIGPALEGSASPEVKLDGG